MACHSFLRLRPLCATILLALTMGAHSADEPGGLGSYIEKQTLTKEPGAPAGDANVRGIKDLLFKNVLDYAYPSMALRWTINPISVCWEDVSASNASDRAIVEAAAAESWSQASAVKFSYWGPCQPSHLGIRIGVHDSGPHVKGLGTRLDGVEEGMVLNFTFDRWGQGCSASEVQRKRCIYSIAVHEFGHALGFAHEQNRPDTPIDLCEEGPQGTDGDTILTPWDLESVMNYCNPTYNNDGILSELDRYAVRSIYGLPQN